MWNRCSASTHSCLISGNSNLVPCYSSTGTSMHLSNFTCHYGERIHNKLPPSPSSSQSRVRMNLSGFRVTVSPITVSPTQTIREGRDQAPLAYWKAHDFGIVNACQELIHAAQEGVCGNTCQTKCYRTEQQLPNSARFHGHGSVWETTIIACQWNILIIGATPATKPASLYRDLPLFSQQNSTSLKPRLIYDIQSRY